MRGVFAALVLVLTLAVVPTASAAGPSLVSTTSISGAKAGYLQVELPQRLDPFADADRRVRLEGGGGILGFVLRSEVTYGGKRPLLQAFRTTSEQDSQFTYYAIDDGVDDALPAGPYRLHLITEAPGRVTVEFPSLPNGNLETTPATPTPFESGPLPMHASSDPSLARFGRTGRVASEGLIFARMKAPDSPPGSIFQPCLYVNAEAGRDDAYDVGCPGGQALPGNRHTSVGDFELFYTAIVTKAADFGLGGNYSSPIPSTVTPFNLETFGAWVSFGPDAASGSGEGPGGGSGGSGGSGGGGSGGGGPGDGSSPGGGSPIVTGVGNATVSQLRVPVKNGSARVPLVCSGEAPCRGTVRLTGGRKRAAFDIAAGKQRTVKVPLTAATSRRVARARKLRVRIVVATVNGSDRRELQGKITLVRSR